VHFLLSLVLRQLLQPAPQQTVALEAEQEAELEPALELGLKAAPKAPAQPELDLAVDSRIQVTN
jgi:hypothetical protein